MGFCSTGQNQFGSALSISEVLIVQYAQTEPFGDSLSSRQNPYGSLGSIGELDMIQVFFDRTLRGSELRDKTFCGSVFRG